MPSDAVHRLRARLPPGVERRDANAWRLRIASLLDRTALRPPGLPPSAVLVVREVAASVPARAVAPGGGAAAHAAWERAVRERLAACHRAAVRPARGRVPAGAGAVVFADEAEWLACVLADAGQDGLARWWWPPRLRRPAATPIHDGLAEWLCDEARAIPPALEHLARWGAVATAFRALPPLHAESVLRAVLAAYGVRWSPTVAGGGAGCRGPRAGEPIAALRGSTLPSDIASTLAPAQARLLAVALALVRAPGVLRRPGSLQSVLDSSPASEPSARPSISTVRAASEPGSSPGETPPSPGVVAAPRRSREQSSQSAGPEAEGHRGRPEGPRKEAPALRWSGPAVGRPATAEREGRPSEPARVEGQRSEHGISGAIETRPRVVAGGDPAERAGSEDEAPAAAPFAPVLEDARPVAREVEGGEFDAETARPSEHGVETRLAGVLYLLNLLTHLDVPAAFEAWGRRGAPGPWALLDLVARGLLGEEPAILLDDPLWDALARLDGRRAGAPPGLGVEGHPAVVLPARWVQDAADGEGHWRWGSRSGWLCVWSTAGYPLALTPRDGRAAEAQARAYLRRAGVPAAHLRRRPLAGAPIDPLDGPVASTVPAAVRPWLGVVLPFLRHRLRLALGPDLRVADVLRQPGRLFLTSSHVDLVQPVEAIALPVRRAGLDRDPGWLAAFGRVVYFHFDGPERPLR